jgi:hypothetical protein
MNDGAGEDDGAGSSGPLGLEINAAARASLEREEALAVVGGGICDAVASASAHGAASSASTGLADCSKSRAVSGRPGVTRGRGIDSIATVS